MSYWKTWGKGKRQRIDHFQLNARFRKKWREWLRDSVQKNYGSEFSTTGNKP